MLSIICKVMGLLTAAAVAFNSFASECASYEEIQTKLKTKYGEQMVFSGFANSEQSRSANAVYEFWANPEQGNWSLIANKLVIFQYNGDVVSRNCVSIIDSGKRYHRIATRQDSRLNDDKTTQADEQINHSDSDAFDPLYNCIPRILHAQALKDRHDEKPLLQGVTENKTLIEIYTSDSSWTITQVKAREVKNMMTGVTLTDEVTGQEIHQFCSSPSYSGKSWSLFPIRKISI